MAASPARYAVERGDWKAAAALEVRPTPQPYVTAITWFAKALGAARSGDETQARIAIVTHDWRTATMVTWNRYTDVWLIPALISCAISAVTLWASSCSS